MNEITTANYIGYLWKSDQEKPDVYHGDKAISVSLTDGENPFIIEGNLWDADHLTSISIKFVDGKYIVNTCTLTEEDMKNSDTITRRTFIAHRIEGEHHLKFMQFWKEEPDSLCEGMTTLIPDKLVFVGFENKKQGGQES